MRKKPAKPEPELPTATKPWHLSVSIDEKIFFAKHLAVMIRAGIPLREALEALHEQAAKPGFRSILASTITDINGGQILAFALGRYPTIFDAFFTNVVRVGESSGTLPDSLQYLALQLEKSRELTARIRAALIYPIIVFVGAIGIGVYLAFGILPKLVPLFRSLGGDLPVTTRALLATTAFIRDAWVWILAGIGAVIVAGSVFWRRESVRRTMHHVLLALPVMGSLARRVAITQFARILGTLLTAGVKIVPAIEITARSLRNLVYRASLERTADAAERGEAIAEELRRTPKLFDATAIAMVRVGERTGRLAEGLLTLASFTEEEVDRDVKALSSFIEPVVLIVVGLLVGFVALSVISPIYQITQSITK